MSASVTADPVRQQVEETLHRVFDAVTAIPCGAIRRVKRNADRSVERVSATIAGPIGVLRSVVDLTLNSVFGGGSSGLAPSHTGSTAAFPAPASAPPDAGPSGAGLSAVVDGDPDDAAAELPLHGYESLAASQVVARLARLEPAELESIRAFELAHRGRRTILGKIDQLLAGA